MAEVQRPSMTEVGRAAQSEVNALEQAGHYVSREDRRAILARHVLSLVNQPPFGTLASRSPHRLIVSTEEYFEDK